MNFNKKNTLNILLADDDNDDRLFFAKAMRELSIPSQLATINDGEKLMNYIYNHQKHLPDVLFLDLNMPRKNGSECLTEIKSDLALDRLPMIIFSTDLHEDLANLLFYKGAHYYIRKPDIPVLKNFQERAFTLLAEKKFARPPRDEFIISLTGE